jgi:hypothetical protein
MICRILISANFLFAGLVAAGQETSALPDAPSAGLAESEPSNLKSKGLVKVPLQAA